MARYFILVVTFLALTNAHARGNPFLDQLLNKQSTKSKSRFTLSDWLSQKKSFKAQDHWLAMNTSSSFFEMVLSGGTASIEKTTNGGAPDELDLTRYSGAIYVTIFGVEHIVEDVADDYSSQSTQFNLRLLGTAAQGTNLTTFYGQRSWQDELTTLEVDNNYWGVSLALYLAPFLGIEGKYINYLSAESNNSIDIEGSRTEFTAFLELSLFRIFGTMVDETLEHNTGATTNEFKRDGVYTGLSLFF